MFIQIINYPQKIVSFIGVNFWQGFHKIILLDNHDHSSNIKKLNSLQRESYKGVEKIRQPFS